MSDGLRQRRFGTRFSRLRRPGPMFVMQLIVVALLISIRVVRFGSLRDALAPATSILAAVALSGAVFLFFRVRREFAANPGWADQPSVLNAMWSIWGPAACMMYGVSGFDFDSLGVVIDLISAAMLYAGLLIATIGSFSRRGTERHCAVCDYPTLPDPLPPGARCSECGGVILVPGTVVYGHKVRRPRLIALGAAIFLASMVLRISAMTGGIAAKCLFAIAPNGLLLETAFEPRSYSRGDAAWAELTTRSLTESELDRVVRSVIARPAWSFPSRSAWIVAQLTPPASPSKQLKEAFCRAVAACPKPCQPEFSAIATQWLTRGGGMPANVADLWFSRDLRIQMKGDQPLATPAQFSMCVQASSSAGHHSTGTEFFLALASAEADGMDLNMRSAAFTAVATCPSQEGLTQFKLPVHPSKSGKLTVRAKVWVVLAPMMWPPAEQAVTGERKFALNSDVQWTPSGAPLPLPGTIWMHRYDLERTIEVQVP